MPPSRRVPASAPSLLPRARSLVAATALLCVVVLSDAVLPARADPMPREVLESLPDWEEDIGLRRALKCNGASRGRVARARFSSASASIGHVAFASFREDSNRAADVQPPVRPSPLSSTACAIAVNELVENLNAKRAKMRRKLTTDEAITALERGCITARKDWGLQMRNNKCVVRRRRERRRRGVFVGPRPSLPRSPIPDACTWINLNPEP